MSGSELPAVIGFIGLGRMGNPIARHMAAAGVTVRGYDTATGALAALDGVITPVNSVAEATKDAQVVILMLPDSNAVETVVDGGLLGELSPGTLVVDMSSSEPLRTRALAQRIGQRGSTLVDAPVSGGVPGARAATLTIMVGGPEEPVAEVIPLLALAGRVRHVGAVGAGHALKALNNLMSAVHLLGSSEAILAGQRFGLDPAVVVEAVNGSSGRSGSTENKWPNYVLPETYDSGFSMGLMVKDIRIALDLAEATAAPHGLAARAVELWSHAVEALGPQADHTEIARWLRGGVPEAGSA